jgi:hypothetical protein
VVTALALVAVGPGALVAAGDDGPTRSLPPDRPTRTVLRPNELPEFAPPIVPRQSAKEVILVVGGIGSAAPDGTYDQILKVFGTDPRYELHRFGGDPAFPYDTLGPLRPNGERLTAEVRELAKTHPAIHIVAHSMGGPVVDDALARGLSSRDKVVTYIALAAPHNGSTEAAIARSALRIADVLGVGTEFREITAAVAMDVGSPAVADLAVVRAGPPPAGIVRLEVRVATDGIVTAPDARTPGVGSRILLPTTVRAIEGHGGATTDPQALALIASTIERRATPPIGWRERALGAAAEAVSAFVADQAPRLYLGLCLVGLCAAGLLALYRRRPRWLIGMLP